MTDGRMAWLVIVAILVIDQIIKINVKSSMMLGESIHVTDWCYINFIENNGMAYGMTFINKLFLSILRIVVITGVIWYIWQVVKQHGRTRYVFFLSMIVAGAAGNIFDSMFYGLIFTSSTPYEVATFVPWGTGYAPFLMGKVVDMFYFPLIHTTWPDWVPLWGGRDFVFFSPVFNFADASITVGVICLLLFCRKDLDSVSLKKNGDGTKDDAADEAAEA